MQEHLISILTPFKNTEQFLSDCVDSIINQSYTNWELIIIDDNSTDTSFKIVENYAKKDSRIKLLKNKGNGIIDALRLALKTSKGDYITRMDSDDIMVETKLETLLKKLLDNGKNHVAVGLVKYFSANGINDGYAKYEAWLNELTKTGDNYFEIYKECVIPSPCWMIHKQDLITCDAFNSETYPEDYDLVFRFYKHKFKVIPCDKVLHLWRDYSSRASRTDSNYAENHFLKLKSNYFLELHYDSTKKLIIWGAGNKGKTLAKLLIAKEIPFIWVCDNPKKIGKHIYNIKMKSFSFLNQMDNYQSIITVANTDAQKEIIAFFKTQNKQSMIDYFFFC